MLLLVSSVRANAVPLAPAYKIAVDTEAKRLHVELTTITPEDGKPLAVAIPAWTPGYYQILHYETDIENVRVTTGDGKDVSLEHPSAREWRVPTSIPSGATVTVRYDVNAHDDGHGFFGSVINANSEQAYINPTSALMYVVGHTDAPVSLALSLPEKWKVASPLQPESEQVSAEPIKAANYDELMDSPLQLGKFDVTRFTTDGIPFRCVLVGKHGANYPRLHSALAKIAHAEIGVFGSAPFRSYTFYYHMGGAGFGGGLEHRNSTVIHLDGSIGDADSDVILSVSAHELFHAWNVKRLRPVGLGPFDYTQAVRTPSVWFAEGVTDYYADVALVRAGLRNRAWFYDDMAERIKQLDNNPSGARVTLEDASRKAWEGGSEGFDGLSYYLKGSLIGFWFDLRLRALSNGEQGLDDVMRELEARYGQRGTGYPESAILSAINKVAGIDLSEDYAHLVQGTDEINWKIALAAAGLELRRTESGSLGVKMAKRDAKPADAGNAPTLDKVEPGLPAERIGLKSGDQLLRINNTPVTDANIQAVLRAIPPRAPISVLVRRDGQTESFSGNMGVRYSDEMVQPIPNATPTKLQVRTLTAILGKE